MEVRFRPLRCLDCLASVLSLGFLPLFFWFYRRQMPAKLTEEGMILGSGRAIPWGDFTRVKITDHYFRDAFVGTRYLLWHRHGRVEIGTDKVQNSQAVMQHIMNHLPPTVVGAQTRSELRM
jgi:hypothetical protein